MGDTNPSIPAEVLKGSTLGLGAVTAATPFLNWNNHRSAGMPFLTVEQIKQSHSTVKLAQSVFSGWRAYALGVVPSATIAITSDALLRRGLQVDANQESALQKIAIASAAGAISGAVTALPEGIAQAQQLNQNQQKMFQVMQAIWRLNGVTALTRGTSAVAVREGLYVAGYYALTPLLAERIEILLKNKAQSELAAAFIAGGTVGFLTTPLHCQMRYQKQRSMLEPGKAKSYYDIAKDIYTEAGGRPRQFTNAFFKNAVPRSVTTIVATLAMFKGKQFYDVIQNERSAPRRS